MKLPPNHRTGRVFLAMATLLLPLFANSRLRAADLYEIVAEADTFVDPAVGSIPQGSAMALAASYDPVGGTNARSYIRFLLPDLSPVTRIVSARLDLRATFALGGGGEVDIHRADNDTWDETFLLWSSQPGFDAPILDTATVLGFGPISTPVRFDLSNWETIPDLTDGKVSFVLKARETVIVGGINFSSREGAFAPTLVLDTRLRGNAINSDWEAGTDPWELGGAVSLVADPGDPANTVAKLSTSPPTGAPASVTQVVDTPYGLYGLAFHAEFLTATGTFSILVGGEVVASFDAPMDPPGGLIVTNKALRGLNDAALTFRLDGPEGGTSELLLDDITFFELPEPPLSIDLSPGGSEAVLSFLAEEGACYQLRRSTNLDGWSDFGRVVAPLGLTYETTVPIGETAEFFQLEIFGRCEGTDATIANWSFEDPVLDDNVSVNSIPGWTNTSGTGVWNPPPAQYSGVAPEGRNIAYAHNGHSLRQTLPEVLEPFRRYRLDASLGKRTDIGWPTSSGPTLQLRAGGVVLTPVSANTPVPAAGEFGPWSQEYVIGKEHPQLGQSLEIVIDGGGSGIVSQINLDDLVLVVQ